MCVDRSRASDEVIRSWSSTVVQFDHQERSSECKAFKNVLNGKHLHKNLKIHL